MTSIKQRSCTICAVKYWHNAQEFQFARREVNFCPTCWADLTKVVNIPDERTRKMDELFEALAGYNHVVINRCLGSFSMSFDAKIRYLDLIRAKYTIHDRVSRHDTQRYGRTIKVNDAYWDESYIERDDPYLVQVVREMGTKVNTDCSSLKIVSVPADVDWEVTDYDGLEFISERHRIWV